VLVRTRTFPDMSELVLSASIPEVSVFLSVVRPFPKSLISLRGVYDISGKVREYAHLYLVRLGFRWPLRRRVT
jgi:hypothetical protein